MAQEKDSGVWRTLIVFIIFVPVIGYLIHFSIKKNAESESRAKQCHQQCTEQGFAGYEFKWNILSGPVCTCLNGNE